MLRNRLEEDEFTSDDDAIIGPPSPVDPKPAATTDTHDLQHDPTPTTQQLPIVDPPNHTTANGAHPATQIPAKGTTFGMANLTLASPLARFKAAGRAVLHVRALSQSGVGSEPGIDVRRDTAALLYGHIYEKCEIEVIDFDQKHVVVKRFDNNSFHNWLQISRMKRRAGQVRWINVGGLSWDVVSELGLKYDLHPLALEDVLSKRKLTSTKADYFTKHLFLRILCHQLEEEEPSILEPTRSSSPSRMEHTAPIASPLPINSPNDTVLEKMEKGHQNGSQLKHRGRRQKTESSGFSSEIPIQPRRSRLSAVFATPAQRRRAAESLSLNALKGDDRIPLSIGSMFIFLCRDGTVISFHQSPNLRFTSPIALRIKTEGTSLRSSGDASMLVYALIDLAVDKALEIVEAYNDRIQTLEHRTLLKTRISTVRSLHILSGDLILLKRTLEPLKQLVYALRRYDLARSSAVANNTSEDEVTGFMSHKAKVYLADVVDHVEHILSSLDMFSAMAENLINFTFNVTSSQTNEIMRRFTVVTVICLPLTLLTGYFGMNFHRFNAITFYSDAFFWAIAIPVVSVVILISLWPDFYRMFHYVKKRYFYHHAYKNL